MSRRKIYMVDGVEHVMDQHTTHCSGCTELGDNHSNAPYYPFDKKAGCYVGMGCHECGYTGKRRHRWLVPKHAMEVEP